MFRIVSIIGFGSVLAGIIIHYISSKPKLDELLGHERQLKILDPLRLLIYLFTNLLIEQNLALIGVLRKLVYVLGLICFLVLLVTGFYQPLLCGEHISGFLMMIHATLAPVFAICVAVLAVMWAGNCVFDKNYWPWLTKLLQRQAKSDSKPQKYEFLAKICFWVIIVLALPLILSIVLSMFKIFGTYMQELLLDIHRYTALVTALVIILHIYLMVRGREGE